VDLDRALRQREVAADQLVGLPLDEQAQHVGLALRESDLQPRRPRRGRTGARIRGRRDRACAAQRRLHRCDHLRGVRALRDVAARPGGERAVDRRAVVRRREHDDRETRPLAAQLGEEREPARSRQREVEQHRIAIRLACEHAERLVARARGEQRPLGLGRGDILHERLEDQRVVVDDDELHGGLPA